MSVNILFNSSSLVEQNCVDVSIAFYVSRMILLLPFSIIILYLGVQKWRQQRSLATATHSDFLAYHLAAMELIWVIGCLFFFFYFYNSNDAALGFVGQNLVVVVFYGEILFHVLTCAERYLAVVHPVIYVGLKNTRGIRIRNVLSGFVWVLCLVLMTINDYIIANNSIPLFCILAVSIMVTFYCCVSVLCVLIRPGPGNKAKAKERVDQSKRRAFYTITAISATLCLWFVGIIVSFAYVAKASYSLYNDVSCLVMFSVSFLNLPSCLVSPLLYLNRAGKLTYSYCRSE